MRKILKTDSVEYWVQNPQNTEYVFFEDILHENTFWTVLQIVSFFKSNRKYILHNMISKGKLHFVQKPDMNFSFFVMA